MATLFDTGYNSYRNMLMNRLLMKECRLKTLRDLCLECVGKNLNRIIRASQYLAPLHKELVIERLAFHDQFTPEYLPFITYNLFSPHLKRINFYKCNQIDEITLKRLAESKCQLHFLTIHGCDGVNDAALLTVTKDQKELRELELRKLKITKKGVQNISSPCLEKLDFRGCTHLDNAAVIKVVSTNACIRYLSLVDCHKLTESVIPVIASSLGVNLEVLDVAELRGMSDNCIYSLAEHCPNLICVNLLGWNRLTNESIAKLYESCQSLERLDLSYCAKLIPSTLATRQVIFGIPKTIQELSLNGLQITDGDLLSEGISSLANLKQLKLSGVPALDDNCLEQIMQNIGNQLEYFDISGGVLSALTDDGLRSISTYCKNLHSLGLSLLKQVTGVTLLPLLEDIERATLLRRLLLCVRKLDITVLHAVVDNCRNIEHLDVSGLQIVTDEILVQMSTQCEHLTDINVKACKNITNRGIVALAMNCPLCVMVLSGLHNLTDACILAIANNCPYLEELYISGCERISKAALHYLIDVCIPRVYVSHRLPQSASGTVLNLDTGSYEAV